MTATIKICGLRDYNAIKMSVDSGAKYLGFVCDYPKKPPKYFSLQTSRINGRNISFRSI